MALTYWQTHSPALRQDQLNNGETLGIKMTWPAASPDTINGTHFTTGFHRVFVTLALVVNLHKLGWPGKRASVGWPVDMSGEDFSSRKYGLLFPGLGS